MEYILLAAIIMVYTTQGFLVKGYNINYKPVNKIDSSPVYTIFLGIIVSISSLVMKWIGDGAVSFSATWMTVLLGLLNAAAIFFYNFSLIKAPERGPFSEVNIFMVSGGVLLPLVLSLCMGDKLHWIKFVGIGVMFIAFLLLCMEKGESTEKRKGFYFYCILLLVANGVFGCILELENKLEANVHKSELLFFTYLFSAIASFVLLAFQRKKELFDCFKVGKVSLGFALGANILTALGANMLVLALSYIPSSILYTVQNGGVMVLVAIFSLIILKEKIPFHKWIGIGIAVISTCMLTLF